MQLFRKQIIGLTFIASSLTNFAQHDGHDEEEIIELQQVNITASPFALKQEDVVIPTNTVSKSKLRRIRQSSLGATLNGQPGIHSSSYTPAAGRPIIRGFDGDRISILQNGTDIFDVSFTSPDHGVSAEPLLIERIEVVRGPASLLYGNAAIGGVVNIIDRSLLREPVEGLKGEAELKYGSSSEEKAGGLSVQGGEDHFAWSVNYHKREAEDYDIPGFAESESLRALEEHEHEGGLENVKDSEDAIPGSLENSFFETETFALGGGWFTESATYSVSFNQYESFYGVPGHSHAHAHDDGDDEEAEGHENEPDKKEGSVAIDLQNKRSAFRAEWVDLGELLESMELDASYGDYEHSELAGVPGMRKVGTVFERNGFDLRISGIHRPVGSWSGALGLDYKNESFKALGEEAYIPGNDKRNYALFVVERLDTIWGAYELGGRIEHQSLDPVESGYQNNSETTFNLSAGALKRLKNNSTLTGNLSYNERAPNASELYAFGPHAGTGSFEIGDRSLSKEKSMSADVSWRKSIGFLTGEVTLFYSGFRDYIFLEHLDHKTFENLYPESDDDGLDILKAVAVDAEFYGYELDLRFHIVDTPDQRIHFDLTIDQTRATNQTDNTSIPRIPTRRIGGRLGYEAGPLTVGIGARYHSKAGHLAPEETPTGSYTLAFADFTYHLDVRNNGIEFFIIGRNLFDQEARPHTSFVKDLVPMPGRSVELGSRILF